MRLWLLLSAALLASSLLGLACNTVDPGECWANTSGGLGGTSTVPLGTGDSPGSNGRSPPLHPLTAGTPNPCVSMSGGDTPQPVTPTGSTGTRDGAGGGRACGLGTGGSVVYGDGGPGQEDTQNADTCFGKPATQYIDCRARGLNADACAMACGEAGAPCGSIAAHPYKSGEGIGQLTWCKNGSPTYTCTYTFASGDGCAAVFAPPTYSPWWICLYK